MTKKFKEGDWIATEDGICQVYGSVDYYFEDFFKQEFESLKAGDDFESKVVYKIFCHFDGSPRKTKFFSFLSSKYCDPLEGDYQKIFKICKTENPDLYERFLKRKPSKPITSRVEFSLRFEPVVREKTIEKISQFFKGIDKPFSYEEFDVGIKEVLDTELPENLYAKKDTLMCNTLISLVYSVLEPRNKKFSFLDGVAVKTYCSYDEKKL